MQLVDLIPAQAISGTTVVRGPWIEVIGEIAKVRIISTVQALTSGSVVVSIDETNDPTDPAGVLAATVSVASQNAVGSLGQQFTSTNAIARYMRAVVTPTAAVGITLRVTMCGRG